MHSAPKSEEGMPSLGFDEEEMSKYTGKRKAGKLYTDSQYSSLLRSGVTHVVTSLSSSFLFVIKQRPCL